MSSIPIGYLIHVLIFASATYFAVAPRKWPRIFKHLGLYLSVVNEVPFFAIILMVQATWVAIVEGDIVSTGGKVLVGVSLLTILGLIVIIYRGLKTAPVIRHALDRGLGADWRSFVDNNVTDRLRKRFTFIALLGPIFVRRHDVVRTANIRYGDGGYRNLLDVYQHRSRPKNAPVLIHLHGGAFRSGSKNRQSLPLIYRFASKGWVCISANYRFIQNGRFPDQLIDVKKVIAWVRTQGHHYGADPSRIVIAGSSSGGHLASMAALTSNDREFQPGFEKVDTTVAAAISLYGYYGGIEAKRDLSTSPLRFSGEYAPPFFIIHGEQDSLVPVEDAQNFVDHLRKTSSNPVISAELPGGEHNFDLFHSIRNEAVLDGIESFTSWVLSQRN